MRSRDWQAKFSAFAAQRRAMPFAWGSNDCALFAADAVLAMTGQDPARSLRGYDTALQAARIVGERGGLRQIATDALGHEVPSLLAAIGDVVLVVNEGREMLGVCNGVNVLAPGEFSMAVLGMDAAIAAWKV